MADARPGDDVEIWTGEPSRLTRWSYAAVRGFAQTLQTTQDRIGVVVVGAVAGPATAGVFVVVARIIGALNLVVYAVGQAMNPEISGLLARHDRVGAERLVQRMTAWTMLLVWPVAALLITHGDVVLSLFGPDFTTGSTALELLALAMIVCTAFGHLDNAVSARLLAALDRSRLKHVVAAHLSQQNNRPDLARAALAGALGCEPEWIGVADQEEGFGWREA